MASNTAEKIVHSMYELIAEVGYEKASINKICKNVGVHKSSFYHFFESKEQVLLEIVREKYQVSYEDDLKLIESTRTKEEYLQKMLDFAYLLLHDFADNGQWRKVCAEIDLQSERIPEIKEIVEESNNASLQALQKQLQHGVNISAFPGSFDVKENAEILYTVYLGLDTVIMYDISINTKNVITKAIKRMF